MSALSQIRSFKKKKKTPHPFRSKSPLFWEFGRAYCETQRMSRHPLKVQVSVSKQWLDQKQRNREANPDLIWVPPPPHPDSFLSRVLWFSGELPSLGTGRRTRALPCWSRSRWPTGERTRWPKPFDLLTFYRCLRFLLNLPSITSTYLHILYAQILTMQRP